MIHYKSKEDIEKMVHGGAILHDILQKASTMVEVGMSTKHIDSYIDAYIVAQGAEPGFKRVQGYSWATCICVNEQIVHTPPSNRTIKDGDVVTIDAGVFYKGLHTDSAITIQVGKKTPKVTAFLETGKKALSRALEVATNGKRIGDISLALQTTIEADGYSIVRELTGHGVGKELHEDPYVPCFIERSIEKTLPLEPGLVIAVEVMYAMGKGEMTYESDEWSIKTTDNSLAACFEHSVAITKNGALILT
jgi:methionyl aminopeptidase